jgi:hypothetical protein
VVAGTWTTSASVYPVVLGAGERLFWETSDMKPMRLVNSRIGEGLAYLVY